MTLAIDAVLIFAAVFCIWAGTRKGFVKSLMGLVTAVVSVIAAYAYTPMLSVYIQEKYLSGRITAGIEEVIRSLARDTATDDLFDLGRLARDLPEPFTSVLERYHVDVGTVTDKIQGLSGAHAVGEDTVHALATDIASPTASALSSAIAFLALFLGVFLVLSLLTLLIDLIFHLPVLRGANMFLGFLFGVVEAAVLVSVLAILLSVLVTALGALDPTLFGEEVVQHTIVCSFLLKFNLFERITAVLLPL